MFSIFRYGQEINLFYWIQEENAPKGIEMNLPALLLRSFSRNLQNNLCFWNIVPTESVMVYSCAARRNG